MDTQTQSTVSSTSTLANISKSLTPAAFETTSSQQPDAACPQVAITMGDQPPQTEQDTIEAPTDRATFVLVYTAICILVFLATLSSTIVSASLKNIVHDLGSPALLPWIGSAYLLTCTVSAAISGTISDQIGRKPVALGGITMFVLGCVVCAVTNSMVTMIIGRAVSGIGGGLIYSGIYIILSDMISLRDRAKYQGILNGTSGVAAVVGPFLGGILSDHASWRYCFWINVPIALAAAIIIVVKLKFPRDVAIWSSGESTYTRIARIDWGGVFLLTAWTILLATPLQLGGSLWAWSDPKTIGMLVGSFVALVLLVGWEGWVAGDSAIIPASLFNHGPSVGALMVVIVVLGYEYYGSIYYLSLFFQVCNNVSATVAGLHTIPLIFGIVIMSAFGGVYASRTGNWLAVLYAGPVLSGVGVGLTSILVPSSPLLLQTVYLLPLGLGIGAVISVRIVAVQAGVPKHLTAVVTAVAQFTQLLGGMIGVAITGTVYNNELQRLVVANQPLQTFLYTQPGYNGDVTSVDLLKLRHALPTKELVDELVSSFLGAFAMAYRSMLPFIGLMLIMIVASVRRPKTEAAKAEPAKAVKAAK
ncbi:hypothetical protein HDU96_000966 [Phlyctochytrium bullatum]|nr:hypothetical protein HDU96_000966 [Phlyctochytrium bullatum]